MSDPAVDRAQAWNDYWRGQQAGCLPQASPSIDAAFRAQWHGVAATLPPAARVLDLATGNAAVLRWLREVRDDLELAGVDLAEALPEPPPGIAIHGGVAMEELPFAEASFDAAVSQFGFEYGAIDRAASEAARVLRRGATLSLVTHRASGPIVAQNRHRALGLRWVLDEARLIDLARSGNLGLGALNAQVRAAAERFGPNSAGWQLAAAVAQAMTSSGGRPDARVAAMLDRLERMARGEVARIGALEQASDAVADDGRLESVAAVHGLELIDRRDVLHAADGLVIADFRAFRRI